MADLVVDTGGYVFKQHTLTWAAVTTTDTSPDTDDQLDVRHAESINIVATDSGSAASWDINVHGLSADGGELTTNPINAKNGGSNETIQLDVTPGVPFIKLRADENGGDTAVISAIVTIRYKK